MKRMTGNISFLVIVLLMAAALFTFLSPHFGWSVDTVLSGSMEPQLNVGGVVVTRPIEADEIKAGDIITFYSPLGGQLISHRIVGVEDGSSPSFRTKGDANEDADSFVLPAENVVGKVCFHLPYFGYATQYIKTPLGLLLTLCLPGLIIVAMEVRNIWRVLAEEGTERKYRIRQSNER